MDLPRPEHPKPQFERNDWINLNGVWTFDFDFGLSGRERGLPESTGFSTDIVVPFCPESRMSGVGHTDFINGLWYHRTITIPKAWAGREILLHFGGVDYECEAYLDGQSLGVHYGGTSSFSFNATRFARPGAKQHLVVRAHDDARDTNRPQGKQCSRYASHGCHYTRTTGIWQTVWLEAVDPHGLESACIVPDLDGARFVVTPTFRASRPGLKFRATLSDGGTEIATAEAVATQGGAVELPVAQPKPWEPGSPHLYDLTLEVLEGDKVIDRVQSYAGLRKVHIEGNHLYLNNKKLYFRSVLDQGFYPDGVWTAPSDKALKRDIEMSMAAGFNGARLHQKVFEERFHYWADKLGYLTWAESSSWGSNPQNPEYLLHFMFEWRELVVRDRNHPSIIAWTPFNETWPNNPPMPFHHRHLEMVYDLTKSLDNTRPVNDTSGYHHAKTDLWTVHAYDSPKTLKETLTPDEGQEVWVQHAKQSVSYAGQPYLVDEYGGIKWFPENEDTKDRAASWGYGETPTTLEAFYERLEATQDIMLSFDHIRGFCYTQLTDVEQEQNGVYYYDRTEKFDMERIHAVFSRKPEWAEI